MSGINPALALHIPPHCRYPHRLVSRSAPLAQVGEVEEAKNVRWTFCPPSAEPGKARPDRRSRGEAELEKHPVNVFPAERRTREGAAGNTLHGRM